MRTFYFLILLFLFPTFLLPQDSSLLTTERRKAFADYDKFLLVADIRRKEAYKPGDSKARKKRQSSKR